MTEPFRIRSLSPEEANAAVSALAQVLADCVWGGGEVSFMADMTLADAEAYWRSQTGAADGRTILAAEDDAGIFGAVQVVPAWPPNQPHRADIAKLIVHRRGRRRGAAEALMRAAEDAARSMGRTLVTLDTSTGGTAERLYERLGWIRVGEIPDYALTPDGAMSGTTIFYKALDR
jgi:ribosomal protein S18 acetylase RimI-like enzyme